MLGKARHVHFIGIGGIGMSGIAEVLLNLGFVVSGSDIEKSPITESLASIGVSIQYGHDEGNIRGCDVVVFSSAIGPDNPEMKGAIGSGIPIIPRSEMLGELMRMRTGIAIAGAHGKTTTTSLAAVVLEEAGLDPTVVGGGKVKSLRPRACSLFMICRYASYHDQDENQRNGTVRPDQGPPGGAGLRGQGRGGCG